MDTNTWNWAFSHMISALVSVFNYAVQAAGVATVTILALIWIAALVRLIVAPLIGRSIGGMLDTAMYDTKRQVKSASKEFDRTSKEKQKMYYKK